MKKLALLLTALLAPTAAVVIATGPPASAATHYHVVVHRSPGSIDVGGRVRIHGRVTHGPVRGRSVTLFWTRYSEDDSLHRIGRARLTRTGHFSRWFHPHHGEIVFIARMAAHAGHGKGSATSGHTHVYSWTDPEQRWYGGYYDEPGANGATDGFETTIADQQTYHHALVLNDGATAGFQSGDCIAARGTVRIPDASAADSGGVDVGSSHTDVNSFFATRTDPTSFKVDTAGALRITGSAGGEGGTANSVAVTGLRLLCEAP